MKITVTNESKVIAKGYSTNGNAKPVFCITTGEVFASLIDAAKSIGAAQSSLSTHLTGVTNSCKGKRFCFLSEVMNHFDEIASEFRIRNDKVKAYDKIIADQEAVKNAKEELAKHKANIEKLRTQLEKETSSMHEVETHLKNLTETNNAA